MSTKEIHPDERVDKNRKEGAARPNQGIVDDSQRWRELASQALAKADEMTDSDAKQVMFKIAEQYERFVKLAERIRN